MAKKTKQKTVKRVPFNYYAIEEYPVFLNADNAVKQAKILMSIYQNGKKDAEKQHKCLRLIIDIINKEPNTGIINDYVSEVAAKMLQQMIQGFVSNSAKRCSLQIPAGDFEDFRTTISDNIFLKILNEYDPIYYFFYAPTKTTIVTYCEVQRKNETVEYLKNISKVNNSGSTWKTDKRIKMIIASLESQDKDITIINIQREDIRLRCEEKKIPLLNEDSQDDIKTFTVEIIENSLKRIKHSNSQSSLYNEEGFIIDCDAKQISEDYTSPENLILHKESKTALLNALNEIKDKQAVDIFLAVNGMKIYENELYDIEKLKYVDIANHLDISVTEAKRKVKEIITLLKNKIPKIISAGKVDFEKPIDRILARTEIIFLDKTIRETISDDDFDSIVDIIDF